MKIPVMIQLQNSENGATALCMMLGYHKRFVPIEEMREVCISSRNGSSPEQIIQAAEQYGLTAELENNVPADRLREMKFPLMIRWKKRYYALIKSIKGELATVVDPASGVYNIEMRKLAALFTGIVITFRENENFRPGGKQETLFSLIGGRLRLLIRPMLRVLILTILCVLLNLLIIRLNKTILDEYMGTNSIAATLFGIFLLAVYFILLLSYVRFSIIKTWVINKNSREISVESGIRLFKKMFRQPMRFFEQYSASDMMSRLDTNISIDHNILQSFVPRLIDAVMSLVYIVYLFMNNYIIAGACVAVVIADILISAKIQEENATASKSMMTRGNIVNASLLNGMNMIDTIISSGTERSFYNRWRTSQLQFNESKTKQIRFSALSNTVSSLSGNILQWIQLFAGAYFVTHGSFTLGSMALFQGILGSMVNALTNCISTANQLQSMRTGIERINDIESRKELEVIPLSAEEAETADKLKGRIKVKDLCYRYNTGDHLALEDVSMEVEPGQMVAVVGTTGCGKSTLLKVLADLYKPESGEVLYDGKKRCEIPDVVFHSSISTVDQEAVMFRDSIYNNIKMWDSSIENYEVILAARDAQIHDRIVREKRNYGTIVKENGRNFSGGELQRFELARALAHEPTLLLLDEFTSALDAITEENAMRAIREKGTTCVIVAHRLSTIKDCSRIYVMDKGKIVQEGTHQELYAQEGLYRELVG
ncbi:MAG: ATP-binding cassette domain-containing protein [Eubacteriales bacterium]|nr:ATP-binding cassette domain-containing protein [Eubacteriales bacterium]